MLLREIGARLPGLPIVRLEEAGVSGPSLGPAFAAILALLHLDQVPANHPLSTGAEVARVLDLLERPMPVAELEAAVGGWSRDISADEARRWLHRILDAFASRGLVTR